LTAPEQPEEVIAGSIPAIPLFPVAAKTVKKQGMGSHQLAQRFISREWAHWDLDGKQKVHPDF
jgi:hypothetical protein